MWSTAMTLMTMIYDADVFDEAKDGFQQPSLQPRSGWEVTQHERFRQARYGSENNITFLPNHSLRERGIMNVHQQASTNVVGQVPGNVIKHGSQESPMPLGHDTTVEDLQREVEELLKERKQLKEDLAVKTGEISIVRGNFEKATKEYEREITATKRINAERIEKQQRAIDSAKEAEKRTITELEFLKRDLHDEAEQVKLLKRAIGKEKTAVADPLSTPRKQPAASYRDGFEDDELQIISPSKFQGRKFNAGTPTKAGTKRKRKGHESPIAALQVTHDASLETEQQHSVTILEPALLDRLRKPDDRVDFLERMLDHRLDTRHLKTLEEFTKLFFPSKSEQSLASIILERLPLLKTVEIPVNDVRTAFPIAFCELLVSIWKQCLDEHFYKPISLLIDLLTYALELKTSLIGPFIIDSLLQVAQATGTLVALPRYKNTDYAKYAAEIDVSSCLEIMHLAALGCMSEEEHIIRFWRLMRIDFVQVILAPAQPVKDVDIMLRLLAMSVTNDHFGPRAISQDSQQEQTSWIINRMSTLFVVNPIVPVGAAPYDTSAILSLRHRVLRTFHTMTQTSVGASALAHHTYAVGRLVKLMCDSLDNIYDHRADHKSSARLVNLGMRILYHLVTTYDRDINMQQKLSVIHGGPQKYVILLTRINFSEDDLVLDRAIESEVAEAAHELLEMAVTPEEGDAIHSAFSGL